MKRVYVLAIAAMAMMFLLTPTTYGQTYNFQGPANLSVTAKAGDIVTVTAALSTNDIDEDGEGEPLVVSLPGGTFTVSHYFINQTTHFVALQDNPVVFAQIVGADGDEVARVTFSVRKMRFTQEEKDRFSRLAIDYSAASMGLFTVGGGCGLFPEPLVTKICAGVGLLGGAVTGGASIYYQRLALDPNDPNFTQIVVPVVPMLPTITVEPGVTQAEADAFNVWILNQAQQSAYATAIVVSINRANSASDAGDTVSEQAQLKAAGQFALQLSTLLEAEPGVRAMAQATVQAAAFPSQIFTVNDVLNQEVNVLFFGLPSQYTQVLTAEGFNQDDINTVAGELFVQDPFTIAPNSFPEIMTNSPDLNVAEAAVAQDLINFAVRNGAGTPLAPGQMAQAQGFVTSSNGRKITFATEAHVDQQGNLHGHLELDDHSTGFSIVAGSVTSVTLSGQQFTINGTFVGSDGSAQSFTVTGDATNQAATITTSTGFSVSGPLGGGNVAIKQ